MFVKLFVLSVVISVALSSRESIKRIKIKLLSKLFVLASRDGRIFGGNNAVLGQFPFFVSIRTTSSNAHFCGGSILNNRWVVTAVSCTNSNAATALTVVVGTVTHPAGGVTHGVTRTIPHPGFVRNTRENDVALIETSSAIIFSSNVQPVQLGGFIGAGVAAFVAGFGFTETGPFVAQNLQFILTQTISTYDCSSILSGTPNMQVNSHNLCTFTRSRQGICHRDAGSGLVANGLLVGIAR